MTELEMLVGMVTRISKSGDYIGIYNDMRKAELWLYGQGPEVWEGYQEQLLQTLVAKAGYEAADMLIIASAQTRAQAWLRTLGQQQDATP
jgi:hypothetical protein